MTASAIEGIVAIHDEEQFYIEDDDYDDLYNDVNVNEGFHLMFWPTMMGGSSHLEFEN